VEPSIGFCGKATGHNDDVTTVFYLGTMTTWYLQSQTVWDADVKDRMMERGNAPSRALSSSLYSKNAGTVEHRNVSPAEPVAY